MQVRIQTQLIDHVLSADKPLHAPFLLRLFDRIPPLRWIPARLIGLGVRPEHVRTAPAAPTQS
jgi:hypothetical protein